eukprot:CAMPEP_0177595766 /NCGR_PEP_ID=MMETSP0419_2-20121207/10570_1 /TAXON_ID=582737 /ORGANISM="Tetraselmis sp., Strain GSL018" /LENGTH=259 /DNA_ID=CAMNT_0019087325 /DNA_START=215 /DNA_END=994 /DNA_ORIENTATION=-
MHIHVFLILQPGDAEFVNLATSECLVAPKSIEDAGKQFSEYVNTTVVHFPRKYYDVNAVVWNYPDRGPKKKFRLQRHLNQYLSFRACAREVAKQELKQNRFFDAILRIRDNSLVLRPFLVRGYASRLYRSLSESERSDVNWREMPVVVKRCASWAGYNDKVMLVPRPHMDASLCGMADDFFLTVNHQKRRVSNPEQYAKLVLQSRGVPVHREPTPQNFPIADGRCESGDSFCVVKNLKDCHPADSPVPECNRTYAKAKP